MKWFLRVGLILLLIVVGIGIFAWFHLKATQPPEVKDAPYAIQLYYDDGEVKFPTRYYYAEKVELIDGKAILSTYWTFDGERYHKIKEGKTVNPPFDIIRRER